MLQTEISDTIFSEWIEKSFFTKFARGCQIQ